MRLTTKEEKKFLKANVSAGDISTQLSAKLTATKAATQADSVAATLPALVTDFNALLAKLKAAGIMV